MPMLRFSSRRSFWHAVSPGFAVAECRAKYLTLHSITHEMKEIHYFYVPDAGNVSQLPEEESRHALRVLRLRVGDSIVMTDGEGNVYDAVIEEGRDSRICSYSIKSKTTVPPLWRGHLHIALAPTKNIERTEWFVEKAVEIGVDEISFLDCDCSLRHVVKTERMERIVVSALKQSHKARITKVNGMMSFDEFLSRYGDTESERYIAHCLGDSAAGLPATQYIWDIMGESSKTVMIGPEGDFSLREAKTATENGFVPVSLGDSRLRTETAGLYAVMLMNLKNSCRRLENEK